MLPPAPAAAIRQHLLLLSSKRHMLSRCRLARHCFAFSFVLFSPRRFYARRHVVIAAPRALYAYHAACHYHFSFRLLIKSDIFILIIILFARHYAITRRAAYAAIASCARLLMCAMRRLRARWRWMASAAASRLRAKERCRYAIVHACFRHYYVTPAATALLWRFHDAMPL